MATTALTNKESFFVIPANGQGADLEVKITDPSGKSLEYQGKRTSEGHEVRWTPRVNGPHQIRVQTADNRTVPGYPMTVNAFNPKKVRVLLKTQIARINEPVHFEVDIYDAGSGQLSAAVEHLATQRLLDVDCNNKSPYVYDLVVTPVSPGEHELLVYLNRELVPTRLRFKPITDIEAVFVSDSKLHRDSQNDIYTSPARQVQPSGPSAADRDSAGASYSAHIVVSQNFDSLNLNLPDADYQTESPLGTLR